MSQRVADGNDLDGIEKAIAAAKAVGDKPSLIAVRTVIGYGSPLAGTNKVHGEAMSAADAAATKKFFGFPEDQSFLVPEDALANWREAVKRGAELEAEWNQFFAGYKAAFPELAAEFERTQSGALKAGWEKSIPSFGVEKPIATRNAGQQVMNAISNEVPELFGGAADLTASTKTIFKSSPHFADDPAGRNVFFGVRELGMCAAVNGMAVHGGVRPFGSTFFVFSDYAKPALRIAAIMEVPSLFVFTHDSIGVGEDGPTHEPIEQLMALRAVPHIVDFHPADANETAAAWRLALEQKGPCFFAFTRQDVPVIDATKRDIYASVSKGAYVLEDVADPQVILIGSGSEVWPAVDAAKLLAAEGIRARVVSFPSWKLFDAQAAEYKASVLARRRAQAGRGGRRHAGMVEVRGLERRRDRTRPLRRLGSRPHCDEGTRLQRGECGGEGEEAGEVRKVDVSTPHESYCPTANSPSWVRSPNGPATPRRPKLGR